VKCNLISEGTEVQFGPQENFSLRNHILQTGCVVNSASYLGGPILRGKKCCWNKGWKLTPFGRECVRVSNNSSSAVKSIP